MGPYRVFYHSDLAGRLKENQLLDLTRGLSAFGLAYESILGQDHRFHAGPGRRELSLERMRTHNPNVPSTIPSRLRSVFACMTPHDAKTFAYRSALKESPRPVRIFEIVARPESFHFRDMNWLDYPESNDTASEYVSYWLGRLSLSALENPFIEVCIELPAWTGRIVDEFTIDPEFSYHAPRRDSPPSAPD